MITAKQAVENCNEFHAAIQMREISNIIEKVSKEGFYFIDLLEIKIPLYVISKLKENGFNVNPHEENDNFIRVTWS